MTKSEILCSNCSTRNLLQQTMLYSCYWLWTLVLDMFERTWRPGKALLPFLMIRKVDYGGVTQIKPRHMFGWKIKIYKVFWLELLIEIVIFLTYSKKIYPFLNQDKKYSIFDFFQLLNCQNEIQCPSKFQFIIMKKESLKLVQNQ